MTGEIAAAIRARRSGTTIAECVANNRALDGVAPSTCTCIYNADIAPKSVITIPVDANKTTIEVSAGACGWADFRAEPERLTLEVYREGINYSKTDPLIDIPLSKVQYGKVEICWTTQAPSLADLCDGRLIGFILLDKCRPVAAFRFAIGGPYRAGDVCHTVHDVPECLDDDNRDDVVIAPIADPCCDANDCGPADDSYDCSTPSDCRGC